MIMFCSSSPQVNQHVSGLLSMKGTGEISPTNQKMDLLVPRSSQIQLSALTDLEYKLCIRNL